MKKRLNEVGLEYNKKPSGINYSTKNPFYLVEYMTELEK